MKIQCTKTLLSLLFALPMWLSAAPVIEVQPVGLTTVVEGGKVTLQVTATSTDGGTLLYQFYKVGAKNALTTPTSSNQFVINSAKDADTGTYTVKVRQGTDTTTIVESTPAHVIVNLKPKIAAAGQPKATTVIENALASFTVILDPATTTNTPPYTYTWQRKIGTTWVDVRRVSNDEKRSNSLFIPNAQLAHAGSYRVLIQNPAGLLTSAEAVLKVNSRPVLATSPGKVVTLFQSDGGTAVSEGGATDTYTVILSAPPVPGSNVTVTPVVTSPFLTNVAPAVSTDVTISPANLVFTDANWNTPQVFTVTANDDSVANAFIEAAAPLNVRSVVIGHAVTSTDPSYAGALVSDFLCQITDNDVGPRLVITENTLDSQLPGFNGMSVVTEAGATDTFTVALASATPPASDVVVNFTLGSRVKTSPTALTFTSANYNTPQTVTLRTVDDDTEYQGVQFQSVSFTTVSADAVFNALASPTLNVRINDNDPATTFGVTLIQSGGSTRLVEGGMQDEILVVLDTPPLLPGVCTVTSLNSGIDLTQGGSVSFDATNWFIPQRLLLTAADDILVEATRDVPSIFEAAGAGYGGWYDLTLTIGDNDVNSTAGVRVVATGTTDVTEGGATDSFTVALAGAPTAPVTINLAVAPAAQASLSGASLVGGVLTFTPANWNVPQTVTVTATDDSISEATHTAAVSFSLGAQTDARYSQMIVPDLPVTITDNDNGARIVVSPTAGANIVTEGGATDYFTVVFAGPTAPSSPVSVSLAAVGAQINAPTPSPLTFTNLNWKVPQTVFLSAFNDTLSEGVHADAIAITTVSADVAFNALSVPNVPVTVYDNDSTAAAGSILVTETGGSTRLLEGGDPDSVFVSLRRAPTATVTVTPTLTPAGQVTGATPLVFTVANWNVPQEVSLAGANDAIADGIQSVALVYTASATGGYSALDASAPVTVTVADTTAGSGKFLEIFETSTGTEVTENGSLIGGGAAPFSQDVYAIRLERAPTANVVVTPVSPTPGQVTFDPPSLVFTPANFGTLQNITITAVANTNPEPTEELLVQHTVTSADLGYNNVPVDALSVTVFDDDAGARLVAAGAAGDLVLQEANGAGILNVSLVGPAIGGSATVFVDVTSVNSQLFFMEGGVPANSVRLSFTTATQSLVQSVNVISRDDTVVEGPHADTLRLTIAPGSDGGYAGLSASVPVVILDNESMGRPLISIFEADGSTRVVEGGLRDAYSVVLRRAPTANVVLTPTFNTAQLTLSARALTFTPTNWNVPQTVTVTAFDDTILEGTHAAAVVYVPGATGGFLPSDTASVNVQIGDNEGLVPALPPSLNIAHKATGLLRVTATGDLPQTYRWMKNGTTITNARASSLTIRGEDAGGPTEAVGPGNYSVEITNARGSVVSNVAVVRVIRKPTIKTDLALKRDFTLTVPPTAQLNLEVEANSDGTADFGTLRYQWQKDGKNIGDAVILAPAADPRVIAGTLTRTLTITPVSWLDRGAYRVVISNEVGTITSKTTTVGVISRPIILTQPVNVAGPTNGTAKFSVVAGGTAPLSYQWEFSTTNAVDSYVPISTGKAAALTVTLLGPSKQGFYRCKVTGPTTAAATPNNVTYSQPAFLQVDSPPTITAPAPVAPATLIVLSGNNIHLKVTATGTNTPENPLIFTWQKNNVDILGGPNSDTLILPTTSTADSGTYRCIVRNLVGTATSKGTAVQVLTAPTITAQSTVVTQIEETPLEISVNVVGSPTLTYQWQKESLTPGVFDPPIPGKTTSKLTFSSVQLSDIGSYVCTIKNAVGEVQSAPITVNVTPIPPATIGNTAVSVDAFYPVEALKGEKVRLHGLNLQYTRSVTIGGVNASFVIESNTAILITVPDTAPTVPSPIVVRTKNATPTTSTQLFTRSEDYSNIGPIYTTAVNNLNLFPPTNFTLLSGTTFTQRGNSEFAGGQLLLSAVFYHWRVPTPSACTIQIQGDSKFDCALVVYKQRTTETLTSSTRLGPDKTTRFRTSAEATGTNTTGANFERTLNPVITTVPNQELIIVVQSSSPFIGAGMNSFGTFTLSGRATALPPGSPLLNANIVSSSAASTITSKSWTSDSGEAVSQSVTADGSTVVTFGGAQAKGTQPIELWSNDNLQPSSKGKVIASFSMSLQAGATGGDDQFAWQVTDPQGRSLLSLWVNAADGTLRAVQPDGTTYPSIQRMTPGGGAHHFEINVDPAAGTWVALMDGVPVTASLPLASGAQFGDISAVWDLGQDGKASGASILFDDFAVESEQAP